jgi:hypothetical protein
VSDEHKISERYRELPREEPPRALDDAILAASRRAVKGRNRWYVPLAAAAVIVFAVAVTVHVERQQPGEEVVSVAEPKPFAVEPPAAAPPPPEDRRAQPEALAKRADQANAQLGQAEAARERREAMASAAAPASRFAQATPEQWLLAIDDLKRQGKHDEAVRELAEFRKRYPNYRIPEAITEKFETR